MAKRGRPNNKALAEIVADDVVARLFVAQIRVTTRRDKAKGQQRIGFQLRQLFQMTADKFGLSARTVETYYRRHRGKANERWIAEMSGDAAKAAIRAERSQVLRKLSRRK